MAATVELTTTLDCSLDQAWHWVQRPALLDHIASPLLRFGYPPSFDRDGPWTVGEHRVQLYAFGVVPLGWQIIGIELPETDDERRILRDNGRSPLISRWDHWIVMAPSADGEQSTYTDRVHIEAGLLTPAIAAYARRFYAHRQKRWRALAASDFAALQR